MKSFRTTPIFWITIVFSILVSLSGCKDSTSTTSTSTKTEKLLIGISMADLKEERWKRDRDLLVKFLDSLGAVALVQDAGGDPQVQIDQCKNLVLQGVKTLIVVPKNAAAGAPIVINAQRKGVKVISYDRMISNSSPDFYVSFDNYRVGRIQAEEILKVAPKGKYLLLGGDPADLNSAVLRDGQLDVLRPAIENGQISVVAEPYCDRWMRQEATRYTEDTLAKHPDLTAIVSSNDGTASGAIAALEAKGKAGTIYVSGQDADLEACRNIVNGKQTATVYKPIKKLAEATAKLAVDLANNVPALEIAKEIKVGKIYFPDSGDEDGLKNKVIVPTLLLDPIAVTKENIFDTVVADEFHSKEELLK